MKYTFEFKLECINKYKNGEYIETPSFTNARRHTFLNNVRRWVSLYERFGIDGIKRKFYDKKWTDEEKFKIVVQSLSGKPLIQVALENGINEGQLYQWVRLYQERGMDGLECHKGRKPKVPNMPKKKKAKLAPSEKEELELLRARNEYLEAENIYLKKLDALVTKREAAHPKAKKQKSSKK